MNAWPSLERILTHSTDFSSSCVAIFRLPRKRRRANLRTKDTNFDSLSWLGEMARSAAQPLVVAEVVEDPVGGTEEAFVVEREVVPLQETDRLLPVQTTRHNSRINLKTYDSATKLTRNLDFIASPMAQNERVGWSTCIQSVARRLCSLSLLIIALYQTLVQSDDWPSGRAGVDYYFIQDDGCMFKVTLLREPYFYIACKVSGFREMRTIIDLFLRCSMGAKIPSRSG